MKTWALVTAAQVFLSGVSAGMGIAAWASGHHAIAVNSFLFALPCAVMAGVNWHLRLASRFA